MPLHLESRIDERTFVPHDHDDRPLKIGDTVSVPCVITGIDRQPEYINVAMETVWPMYPGHKKTSIILNTKQVLLIEESAKAPRDSVHVMDVIEEIGKTGSGIIKGRND